MPHPDADPRPSEPVWLVRSVLVLFLIGFAAFLGREVQRIVDQGFSTSQIGWLAGAGLALVATLWIGLRARRLPE